MRVRQIVRGGFPLAALALGLMLLLRLLLPMPAALATEANSQVTARATQLHTIPKGDALVLPKKYGTIVVARGKKANSMKVGNFASSQNKGQLLERTALIKWNGKTVARKTGCTRDAVAYAYQNFGPGDKGDVVMVVIRTTLRSGEVKIARAFVKIP